MHIYVYSWIINVCLYGAYRNMINPDALEAGPYPDGGAKKGSVQRRSLPRWRRKQGSVQRSPYPRGGSNKGQSERATARVARIKNTIALDGISYSCTGDPRGRPVGRAITLFIIVSERLWRQAPSLLKSYRRQKLLCGLSRNGTELLQHAEGVEVEPALL